MDAQFDIRPRNVHHTANRPALLQDLGMQVMKDDIVPLSCKKPRNFGVSAVKEDRDDIAVLRRAVVIWRLYHVVLIANALSDVTFRMGTVSDKEYHTVQGTM